MGPIITSDTYSEYTALLKRKRDSIVRMCATARKIFDPGEEMDALHDAVRDWL